MGEAQGFARLFRPTYAGANMGHPSGFVGSLDPVLAPTLKPIIFQSFYSPTKGGAENPVLLWF